MRLSHIALSTSPSPAKTSLCFARDPLLGVPRKTDPGCGGNSLWNNSQDKNSGQPFHLPIHTGMSTTTAATPTQCSTHSRAVQRDIEPGSIVECILCGERIKFQAKIRPKQVICNVYKGTNWDRVEHFHAPCYAQAGEPHGPADTTPVVKTRRVAAKNNPEMQKA